MTDNDLSGALGAGAAALAAVVVFVQGYAVAAVACLALMVFSLLKTLSPAAREWINRHGAVATAIRVGVAAVALLDVLA